MKVNNFRKKNSRKKLSKQMQMKKMFQKMIHLISWEDSQ